MPVPKESEDSGAPVESAFDAFRKAWFAGTRPDPEAFYERFPECLHELRARIENFLYVAGGLPMGDPDEQGGGKGMAGRVLGDFRILREIGRGGMGVVYEADQLSLNRKVALKVLPDHLSISNESIRKFKREAEAGGRQIHPGIVAVFAVGEHEGFHYIVQELVEEGRTLQDRLEDIRKGGGPPEGYFREAAMLLAEAAEALHHVHMTGVIHRDVKPSNILLTGEGRPKVTDFGLARVEGALALSRTGDFSGTPYYMSPEQITSRRGGIDARTDVYSLGVTLYEMLTFYKPFEGESSYEVLKKIPFGEPVDPQKANPRVPRDLAIICLKAMEVQPEKRYQDMAGFAADLKRFLTGEVILAKPAGAWTRVLKRFKKNPVFCAVGGIAVLSTTALLISIPWYFIQLNIRYEEIRSLSDIKLLSQLREKAETLWPSRCESISGIENWLKDAHDLVKKLEIHKRSLKALQSKSISAAPDSDGAMVYQFDMLEDQWKHDKLQELVAGLETFSNSKTGMINAIEDRLSEMRKIYDNSVVKYKDRWSRAVASIADTIECQCYKGLVLQPQMGLVPIGRDPASGLWEFAHMQTGEIPKRDLKGELDYHENNGIVFVLIPEGKFNMGAEAPSKSNNMDRDKQEVKIWEDEFPVHPVNIEPFFMSKFEMTLSQWLRCTGLNPSMSWVSLSKKKDSPLHPVINVNWMEAAGILKRLGTRLPTEAEWEYATRAGTTSIWWTGNDKQSLYGASNMADRNYKREFPNGVEFGWEDWLDDGFAYLAPVGSFNANPFGLHDVYGNVHEWVQDHYHRSYEGAPSDGTAWVDQGTSKRIVRGGSWVDASYICRSSYRGSVEENEKRDNEGIRAARSIE